MAEKLGSEESKENLSSLIKDTVTSLRKDVICEKAVKIQKAVATNIEIFLNKVAEVEPLFRVSELLQVGSYAEGTKILQPDEFDFLAVLEELSEPGTIVVNNDLDDGTSKGSLQTGYVTVAMATDTLKSKWKKYCDKGLLQCFQYVPNRDRFGNVFIRVVLKLCKDNVRTEGRIITCSTTALDLVNCTLDMPPVDGLSLKLRRVEFNTPNVLITFELDSQEISVDLSPAVRYYKIEDCFKANDCATMVLSEKNLSRKSLLLVANSDFYFRVTVTESEVWYIQTVMKVEHRIIYMFLKYINNLFAKKRRNFSPFSSYMLKNVCITHDINCKNGDITTASCFVDVIENLNEYSSKFELPSVVNKNVDLFSFPKISRNYVTEYRQHVIDALRSICLVHQQPKDIHSVEEFKKYVHHHINQNSKYFEGKSVANFAEIKTQFALPSN